MVSSLYLLFSSFSLFLYLILFFSNPFPDSYFWSWSLDTQTLLFCEFFMGFEMKPEKEVMELISSKNQCMSSPNSVNNKKKKKNNNKNKKMMMTWRRKKIDSPADEITAVRRLFNTCKEVFSNGGPGVVPSEDKIQQLREILGIQFLLVFLNFLFWVSIKFRYWLDFGLYRRYETRGCRFSSDHAVFPTKHRTRNSVFATDNVSASTPMWSILGNFH